MSMALGNLCENLKWVTRCETALDVRLVRLRDGIEAEGHLILE